MKNKKVIIIVGIIVLFILVQRIRFLVDQSEAPTEESASIEEITESLDGTVGENEKITNVSIGAGKELTITVDLSQAEVPFDLSDLAITRAGSITDNILDHEEYDKYWDTIIIDFGEVGTVTRSQKDIIENDYGMRCFEIYDLDQ